MTKEQLLSQLKDIHLPDHHPAWWQMAPGWYVLWGLVLILVILSLVLMRLVMIKREQKQTLLWQADDIYNQYHAYSHQYAAKMSAFLKQVVIHYSHQTQKIKQMHSTEWSEYLAGIHNLDNSVNILVKASYNPSVDYNVDSMHQRVKQLLIKVHRRPKVLDCSTHKQ